MKPRTINHSSRAIVSVLLFVIFWSLEILATKLAFLSGAKTASFTVQASLCSLLVLLVWVVPRERPQLKLLFKEERKLLRNIQLANFIHYVCGTVLYVLGISLTTATNVGFLVTLSSVTTTLFAWLILRERVSGARVLLLVLLVAGAYVLTTDLRIAVPQLGDLLILGAAACWSLGNVLMRKALRDSTVSGEIVSLFKPVVGFPCFLAFALLASSSEWSLLAKFSDPVLDLSYFWYAALSGTLAALLWIFLYRALKLAEAAYVSILGMATPVIVAVSAMFIFDEQLSLRQILGATTIILAGLMTHLGTIRR